MANKEKGLFKVKINNGSEVIAQTIRQNSESYYTVFGSGITYYSKEEIKRCKILNSK